MASPASLLSEDVRLLQQADGVLAAIGGGEGEEVGGLGAAGQIKGVNTFSAFRLGCGGLPRNGRRGR